MPKNRLIQEREAHPLPTEKLSRYLKGGDLQYELEEKAYQLLMQHPELIETDYKYYDFSRQEQRKRTLKKIVDFFKLTEQITDRQLIDTLYYLIGKADASFLIRLGVGVGLFQGAILGQGTDEQIAEYLPKLEKHFITGCFCMTELGTGSYIQSFETTATYLPEKDEFVIHSPTLTSTKWWIGGAAQTATHGIVFAQLILNGETLGTHNFIVQLRDEKFNPCPGISIGDVGSKRGDEGVDNGWVRFNQVHIPRTQMLMKWSRVNADGKYEKSELAQLAYGALIPGRVFVTDNIVNSVKKALTIATRYSTIRDQHSMKGKCLLDYTTQQERLIGGIASAYAFHFTLDQLKKMAEQVSHELEKKDVSHLKDFHNLAAGIKGFAAFWANDAINASIFSMGGHGYSSLSALPRILNDFAPSIPYEGDAIVLAQQTASYLIKAAGALLKGKTLEGDSIQYLNHMSKAEKRECEAGEKKDLMLADLKDAAEWLALILIKDASNDVIKDYLKGKDTDESWNAHQLKTIKASKAHIMFLLIKYFTEAVENQLPKELGDSAKEWIPILTQLAELFALKHLEEFLPYFFENEYFPTSRGAMIRKQIHNLYTTLRPYANHLVDAWGIQDNILGTPLGRFDGELYENYFKAVNENPQDIKPDYWEEYLKPFFNRQ